MARSSEGARLKAAIRIHREIAAGTYPSATRLGEILEITPKTARKYISILADSFGLRPQYEPLKHGYFYPVGVKPHLVPRLTENEVVALFLLEEASRSLRDSPVQELLDSVLQKMSLMLPVTGGLTIDQVASALSLRLERATGLPGPDPVILQELYTALVGRQRVKITYRGRQSRRVTTRKIEPFHLTRCEGQWYLIAYCHLREAIRMFVPTRIQRVEALAEPFLLPLDFDAADYFRTAFGVVAGYRVAEVILCFDPEVADLVRERRWHATQMLEELAVGEVRLRMKCSQSQELVGWIMGWGEHVTIERPASLAREVADGHRRAADRQSPTITRVQTARAKEE